MGRPKVKQIDDSLPQEEETKKPIKKPIKKGGDSLVESLKAELGISEDQTKSEKSESQKVSEPEKTEKAAPKEKKTVKKTPKITRSKKYQAKVEELNGEPTEEGEKIDFRTKSYKVTEAIELVKKSSYSKYVGTLEAHINTASTGIRGTISLPFAKGRQLKVAAFGAGAESSGADIVGNDQVLEDIKKGKMDFDVLITTAQWMPKFAPLARVLGPKGLMPNPKNGTITTDLKKAVESYQAGKTEYKTESKAPVMHLALGKLDQPTEELAANIKILLQTLGKSRIKKVTLAPTMGPSVRLDLTSI